MRLFTRSFLLIALLCSGWTVGTASATIVRMQFTVGGEAFGTADFRLFESAMPSSTANFLGYFDRYPGTFIHRNTRDQTDSNMDGVPDSPGVDGLGGPNGDFVVQGGGFEFVPPGNAPQIDTDPPIADEPGGGVAGISNLRGTLSNAKSGRNTVTSQWFVNLADNTFLDDPNASNGGFSAFGRIVGEGMLVFDAIDALEKRNLDPNPPNQPREIFGEFQTLFDDVPVGDTANPLGTLVILSSIEVLDLPAGDYNFDGVVDQADFQRWQSTFGSTVTVDADGNGNGIVDAADYTVWRDSLPAGSSALAIPEPTSIAILAASLAAVGIRRKRT